MSKRNFTLLTIVLSVVLLLFFGFLYSRGGGAPEEGEGTNFISRFNPFGNGQPNRNPDGTTPPPIDVSGFVPPEQNDDLDLIKISSMPIAGFSIFLKERLKEVPVPATPPVGAAGTGAGTPLSSTTPLKPTPPQTEFVPAVRYVDRATGNIYQTFLDKIEERKFSGTIIPRIYEAFFGNKGDMAVLRYLKSDASTIQTFWGVLPKEVLGGDSAGGMEVRGTFLPDNIKDVSLSPDTGSLFYLSNTGDTAVGTVLNFTTGGKVQVFDSPFSEWLSQWPNSKMITLTTKPAAAVPGYMYKLDPLSKSFTQILGGVNGLTTLTSPDGNFVLYGDNNLSLGVYEITTKSTQALGLNTLPEKCVWAPSSDAVYCSVPKSLGALSYPDSWYQGESSFEDQIWRMDMGGGTVEMIADLSAINGGEEIDGIKLSIDSGGNYLLFVNKKDSFLWELRLY